MVFFFSRNYFLLITILKLFFCLCPRWVVRNDVILLVFEVVPFQQYFQIRSLECGIFWCPYSAVWSASYLKTQKFHTISVMYFEFPVFQYNVKSVYLFFSVWLRLTNPTPGIEPGCWMRCAMSSMSSVPLLITRYYNCPLLQIYLVRGRWCPQCAMNSFHFHKYIISSAHIALFFFSLICYH